MKIHPDGSLPRITSSGHSSFNNIMIVKVPGEKPGEFYHDLATIDPTRGDERWPADDYVESLIPGYKKKMEARNPRKEKGKSEPSKVFHAKNSLNRSKKEFQRPKGMNKMRTTSNTDRFKFNKRRWSDKSNQTKHYNTPGKNVYIEPWLTKPWECQPGYSATNPALIQNIDNTAMPLFHTPYNNNFVPNSFQKGKSVGLLGHCPSSSQSFEGSYSANNSFDTGNYSASSAPPLLWSEPSNSNPPSQMWDNPCHSKKALLPHSYAMKIESRLNTGNSSSERRWSCNTSRIPPREHFRGHKPRGRRNFRGSTQTWRRENKE